LNLTPEASSRVWNALPSWGGFSHFSLTNLKLGKKIWLWTLCCDAIYSFLRGRFFLRFLQKILLDFRAKKNSSLFLCNFNQNWNVTSHFLTTLRRRFWLTHVFPLFVFSHEKRRADGQMKHFSLQINSWWALKTQHRLLIWSLSSYAVQ
jgi:hypothetical protein